MQNWCRRSSSSVERERPGKPVAGTDAQQLQWPDSRALHAAALCRDLVDGTHLESQKNPMPEGIGFSLLALIDQSTGLTVGASGTSAGCFLDRVLAGGLREGLILR
ncbi:hypothetical protein EMIT0196P_20273 [Pseudomonas chlororaphis]